MRRIALGILLGLASSPLWAGQRFTGAGNATVGTIDNSGNQVAYGSMTVLSTMSAAYLVGDGASLTNLPPSSAGMKIKGIDQSTASWTTLIADSILVIPLAANSTYFIDGSIEASSTSGTPDLKLAFTAPALSTCIVHGTMGSASGTSDSMDLDLCGATGVINLQGSIDGFMNFIGYIATAGSSGNLVFNWAQNTSNATAVTLKRESFIRSRKQ